MRTEAKPRTIVPIILGILAAIVIFFVLTERQLPLITGDKGALLVLAVIGVAMCTVGGIGPTLEKYDWSHPFMIAGAILGILAFLVTAAGLLDVHLPVIDSTRAAFIALVVIGVVKVGVTTLQLWFPPASVS